MLESQAVSRFEALRIAQKAQPWIVTILALVVCLMTASFTLRFCDSWETRPAINGQWRSCYVERSLLSTDVSCSSPMEFADAEWWTRTRGGTVTEE